MLKLSTQLLLRKIQFLKYMYCNYECKNSQLIILIYDTMNPYFPGFCESQCLKTSNFVITTGEVPVEICRCNMNIVLKKGGLGINKIWSVWCNGTVLFINAQNCFIIVLLITKVITLQHYFVHHVLCTVLFLLSLGLFHSFFSVKMDNIWNYPWMLLKFCKWPFF